MAYGKSSGKGLMGMGKPPSSHKRSQMPNMGSGHVNAGRSPGEATGMVTRSYGKQEKTGATDVGTGSAKPLYGAKSTKSTAKYGTQGITTQGDKAGGLTQGRSATNTGKNRAGSGRQQTIRG